MIFQVVLHAIVFVFYAYDRRHPQIVLHEVFFFTNYAAGALVINYFLLPRYLYNKKYLYFFTYFTLVVGIVVFVEEGILEPIYFPDTKGRSFFGGIHNLLDVFPTIVILSGFKFAWDALKTQKEVEILRHAVRESELQFLKSQVNPHFLFNNLNNLYAHAIENSAKTSDIILALSDVLRYMLYDCKAKYVPLSKEVEHISNFINLSKLQIEERGMVEFTIHNMTLNYQIAPLILVIFIENAFKHSASSQSENIEILIQLTVNEAGILSFNCTNTYRTQSNTKDLSKGIGLANVKTRLQLLYPNSHELQIKKGEKLYEVNLKIDLNEIPKS
ncbi:sensor histidine kinase [Fulvivirga sp. M361]|uniref:sensor histidine kinase n=1 Tax=Fulvivirga sp. M361 TaxID=2594266 RepID=UPI0021063799|nr:histidine kinase [Fulvivirga sp. M361]